MPILQLVTHDGSLFKDAVTEIAKFGTEATMCFSREGLSLTVEDDGDKPVTGLRILAEEGGYQRFLCTESRSAKINLTEFTNTLSVANSGESALSISIKIVEEASSTPAATLNISWFDPPNQPPEIPNQETGIADHKISLRLSKVDNQKPLVEYNESMYEAVAALIPAGFNHLDTKLKNLIEKDGRTEDQVQVVISLTPVMLGFFTCGTGWKYGAEERGDVLVEPFRQRGCAVYDMRFGVYTAEMLRGYINAAKVFDARRLWFHIQDGLPNLVICPLAAATGHGNLGTLIFFSSETQTHIEPFSPSTFAFLKRL